MRARLRLSVSCLSGFAALSLVFAVFGAPSFPPLTGRVVDQANVLDAAVRTRLEDKLTQLESRTTIQLVVATVGSLQGYEIADYGYQLGRHWGIGQQGKNNGVLLLVAPADRKVRIEVGYGLEGDLTDAVTRLIIANAILPRFRAGDYAGGIERGLDDIIQVLSGDADDFKRRAAERAERSGTPNNLGSFVIVLLFILVWWLIFSRSARPPIGGGWPSGGGWSGGGWSGGGGGGYSGGGGSFGGGGSSGSW